MRRSIKLTAFMLAVALILPLFGCASIKNALREAVVTAPPATAAPTAVPTAAPTDAPTSAPEKIDYTFDRETRVYEDEFIRFTAPEGMNNFSDMTAAANDGLSECLLALMFMKLGDQSTNLTYSVQSTKGMPRSAIGAYMTEEELIAAIEMQLELQYGVTAEVEPVSLEKISGENFEGQLFEYSVRFNGSVVHQRLWSVVSLKRVCLTLSYTFLDGFSPDPMFGPIVVK